MACHTAGHCIEHDHPTGQGSDTRRLTIAFGIIAAFMVLEVVGGILSGSLALLADAGHMATDAMAIGLALVARRFSDRPPSPQFPYGHARAQVLAAFVNGIALLGLIGFLLVESIARISAPQDIDTGLMMIVAAIGLVANLAAFSVLHRGTQSNVNMRGALLHVVGDILGSIAAIVSAVVIMTTGWLLADVLVTLLVCALIGQSALRLIRETGVVLLEGAPSHLDGEEIRRTIIGEVGAVQDVHALKIWMLTPEETQATMHMHIGSLDDAEETLRAVKDILSRRFGIPNSTIQIETTQDAVSDTAARIAPILSGRFADHTVECPDVRAARARGLVEDPEFVRHPAHGRGTGTLGSVS